MSDDIAIKVDNISKTFKLPHEKHSSIKGALINIGRTKRGYEKQQVLNDISFEIKKGEFFGIVGRNGSGKSTLLKLIAGIYTPDKGAITINGKLTPFIELGVGFNPELSGRENVFLNGALLGFNRKEMDAMYDEIVAFAELERFMDQKLKNYSSGMQVRLAFSIAIRAQSEILVLDEVLAVGDEAFQRKCESYFRTLKKNEKTVVLVTHSMDNVRNYCDRAIMISSGEIVDEGVAEQVANAYSVENTKTTNSPKNHLDKNIITEVLSDVKVTLLSNTIISELDKVLVKVEYRISKKINTSTYVNLIDINRGIPLYAGSTIVPAKRDGYVKKIFSISLEHINDTNIQVAVSICDENAAVCEFLPIDTLPTFILRRSDYPNSKSRATHAVMFDRGNWLNDK